MHEGWTLALVLLVLPVLLWGNRRLPLAGAAALAATLVGAIALGSWWLFARFQLWWPPLLPAAAAVAIYGAAALAGYAAVRQRARQTRAMFAQYVPPAVVERLIAHPELMRLGGESREVTLMFTDLASFTTLSEQLSADQTVEVLTAYFNAMTPIVHATGGTLDKFIGDAVMAFWGRRWTTRSMPNTPWPPPSPCSRPCRRWWPAWLRAGCRPSTCVLACTRGAWWWATWARSSAFRTPRLATR